MSVVLVTCGVPGIGKSTWAEAQGMPVLSADRERARLGDEADMGLSGLAWQRVYSQLAAFLAAGTPGAVIVDGTFSGRSDRRQILRKIGAGPLRVLAVFSQSPALAHERNRLRPRPVPEAVIERYARRLSESLPRVWDEGWDLVWDVDRRAPWGRAWTAELSRLAAQCGWDAPPGPLQDGPGRPKTS